MNRLSVFVLTGLAALSVAMVLPIIPGVGAEPAKRSPKLASKPVKPVTWAPSYIDRSGGGEAKLTLTPVVPGRYVANLSVARAGCAGEMEKAIATGSMTQLIIEHPEDNACRITVKRTDSGVDLDESVGCMNWHGMSCSFADVPLRPGK